MGYDNECIVNMQSLPGEYFCPVCRTLINPDEALLAPCTHLFCKPCLAYVVTTTHACAYDGYLVTEADSKPLVESNKELAETIGKIAVYCLYHRSNCQWQGTLAESTSHCAGCTFGNSPVVCNRCGTQIIHRQVQEHAQICPGVQPQAQAAENEQAQAAAVANQASSQDPSSAASAGSAAAATTATAAVAAPSAPTAAPAAATAATGHAQIQGGAAGYLQAAQAPTAEQWYQQQQQYQQYYQQYPGHDPYQQQYYAQYQQQAYPQYMQAQMQPMAPQPYMQQPQPQPHPGQPQAQPQPQPQPQGLVAQPQLQQLPQPQPRSQPQPQPHVPVQVPQMPGQQPLATPQQPHPHAPHSHPPPHGNAAVQPYPQPQPLATQARPPQLQAPPQFQQPIPPQQIPQQMPHPHAYTQLQPRPQHAPQPHPLPHSQQPPLQMQSQPQPQPHPHPHPQAIPQTQHPQAPAHPVSGYQSCPQHTPGAPLQHPMHMNPQQQGMPPQHSQSQGHFPPQHPPQMHPSHSQMTMPVQQQPAMPPPQGPTNLYSTQQQVKHPVHQPGPPVYQQPGMQPHAQHDFAQPQAQGPLHPVQPPKHGPAPLQQSLWPQGPAYMQQPTLGHPHAQLNAPPAQGMPPHQAQARHMMASQGMPQQPVPQSPVTRSKLMQPGMIQQSPNRNYMGKANPREPTSSELQSGPIQQSQLLHARSQGASPATPKQGASTPDKIGKVPPLEDGLAVKNAEGSKAGENISEHVFDSKSKGDEGKGAIDAKGKDVLAEENRDASETVAKEENVDGQLVKQVKAEEANASDDVNEGSHGLKVAQGENDIKGQEGKFDDKPSLLFKGEHTRSIPELHTQQGPDKSVQREPLQPNPERTNQGYFSDGQISGNVNLMHPQQMQTQGALDRGQLQQQSAHQNVFPSQGHGYPQPGYSDRNPSQFPQQYPGSDEHQGMPPGGLQQIPYGHPHHMPDLTMTSQRPPAHDRMFPQPITQSSQERRFPEPSSHQMHAHGHAMPPCQMRPPGHNVHESFPHQGKLPVAQEPFWPPPHTGIPGPGLPPPPGGVPSCHGLPPKGFDQQAPPGQTQSHPPPPHVGGARTALGEPLARPIMRGPSPGTLDTPNKMMGGPPFIPEDRMGKSANVRAMEAEAHAIKRHGVFDGRQLESHRPLPTERAPYGQPVMTMNGMTNHVPVGGMHESNFCHGLPEDRFRPLPEERFKPFPEEGFKTAHDERFRASALGPGRPARLDGEGLSRFDGYLSSSRPLEKVTQQPGGANALISRPPSSYQSGAPLPPSSGGSQVHLEMGDRDRPLPLHDHPGRRHDGTFGHPDRLNLVSDFGRHGTDGLPPVRSPGNFSRDIPDGLPSQLRRGLDGFGSLPHSFSSNIRDGEMVIPQNMPGFLRGGNFGGFRSHLDSGETGGPGNLHSHLHIGDPGFNGRFSSVSHDGDIHSFEQSRKRKAGSMSRCLICKIDCDTIEALDLHSQTREHHKMAMDMVLSIKKENAKKHRTSENATPFENANNSRKPNFGKRANA